MASPALLDLPRLLAPIAADQPVGVDLRSDTSPTSTYYAIRDARNQARTAERQAQMNGDSPIGAADWEPIVSTVPDVLASVSKDLELAAYLVEGLLREHGFPGLRDGFQLLKELIAQYGDVIYPLPDEDGVETRVAPLTGLNGADGDGTLISPIRNVLLTEPSIGDFTTASYLQAVDLERATPEQRDRRIAQGAVSLDAMKTALAQTRTEFLVQLYADLEDCLKAYADYQQVVDSKFGSDAPPTSNIRNALQSARDALQALARDRLAANSPAGASAGNAPSAAAAPTAAAPGVSAGVGSLQTREDAFRQMEQIALFFRRTEPHTPISYAIDQVVRWGRMPLPDLLRELIPESNSVQQMFRLVGIPQDNQ